MSLFDRWSRLQCREQKRWGILLYCRGVHFTFPHLYNSIAINHNMAYPCTNPKSLHVHSSLTLSPSPRRLSSACAQFPAHSKPRITYGTPIPATVANKMINPTAGRAVYGRKPKRSGSSVRCNGVWNCSSKSLDFGGGVVRREEMNDVRWVMYGIEGRKGG